MKATSSAQRKLPEQGRQAARCYAIIDLGTQQGFFKGQPKEPAAEIMIIWELPKFMHVFQEGEPAKPLVISQKYTLSSGQKAKLPKVLKAWGKMANPITSITPDFLSKFVGQWCMLDIEHNASKKDPSVLYANIGNSGLDVKPYDPSVENDPKFQKEGHNEAFFFDLDKFSWEAYKKVPEWIQKTINKSLEWPQIVEKNPAPANIGNTDPVQTAEDDNGGITFDDGDAPSF